jgi:hypothetical protein
MKQELTLAYDPLDSFAEKAADGAHLLEATIGLVHNKEIDIRAVHSALRKANLEHRAAFTARIENTAARSAVDKEVTAFITSARDVLKPKLGARYNEKWGEVGFRNRTLRVPGSLDARRSLLKSLELYFESHPEMEVGDLQLTQIHAGELYTALSDSINALSISQTSQRDKNEAKTDAMKAVRNKLRNLFQELKQLLDDNDSRWQEFGFKIPAELTVPEKPTDLLVVPSIAGSAMLSWERSVGSTRYRVFRQIVGTDEEFVHVDTLTDLSKTLTGLPSGAHVKFYITAANGAGESQPSATVEVVVP